MPTKSKKGFTLVEIMIVVVIIGLLAAMAIPAFQKVRESSIAKTVVNDGRQIGSAAQQYFMEEGVTTVVVGVTSATGEVTGPLSEYVTNVSKKLTLAGSPIETSEAGPSGNAFTLAHEIDTITFNNEGDAVSAAGSFADDID